jgi:hypothetical protein
MTRTVRIGNAQAFWGDDSSAPLRLVEQAPDLDWLTLDYLAEVSMSILARQREKDASLGYARDFIDVVESLVPVWKSGRKLSFATNAGGLNPPALARACAEMLRRAGCRGLKIGIVTGDDVLGRVRSASERDLITANAYLGAESLVEAIQRGADVIVTGRVADPSLTVAPCIAHFNWNAGDYDAIAGATVAGHLIECGTQVTGGISTDWLDLPDPANIGFPIVEVSADGSCVVTKPPGTGGRVDAMTVKEQLLYEIGNPANYLSPDATVSFVSLGVTDEGNDRVRIGGATGRPPPQTYKVSATYRAGYRASGMLTIFGRDAAAKAQRCGQIVLERLRRAGFEPQQSLVECLGAGAVAPCSLSQIPQGERRGARDHRVALDRSPDATEVVLRITVADERREVVERFTREIVPLVTSGPQGTTGYFEGRPQVREMFGYLPLTIPREQVDPRVEMLEV